MTNSSPPAPSGSARALVVALLALVALIGLLLAVHSAANLHHRLAAPLPYPQRTDVEGIQGWMTVPFVARRYRVPSAVIFQALGIQPEGNQRRSLDELARQQGRSPDVVVVAVRGIVADYQAAHPEGTPTSIPPGAAPSPGRAGVVGSTGGTA